MLTLVAMPKLFNIDANNFTNKIIYINPPVSTKKHYLPFFTLIKLTLQNSYYTEKFIGFKSLMFRLNMSPFSNMSLFEKKPFIIFLKTLPSSNLIVLN